MGKPYPVVDAAEKHYFKTPAGSMSVKYDNGKLSVQQYDAATLKQTCQESLSGLPDKRHIVEVLEIGERLYVIYSTSKAENELLYARALDRSQCAFLGEEKLLLSVPGRLCGSGYGPEGQYRLVSSLDKKRLLVTWRINNAKKKLDNDCGPRQGIVLNDRLEQEWKGELELPTTEHGAEMRVQAVDGRGSVWFVVIVYDEPIDKKDPYKGRGGHLELMHMEASTGSWQRTPVDVGNMGLHEIRIFEGADGGVICAGYYSDRPDATGTTGVFSFSVDASGKIGHVDRTGLPEEVITAELRASEKKVNAKENEGKEIGIPSLEIIEVIPTDDGGYITVGEQRTSSYRQGSYGSSPYSTFNDVLVVRARADGQLVWVKKISKRQSSPLSRNIGVGCAVFRSSDKLTVVYMDHPINLDRTEGTEIKYFGDGHEGHLIACGLDLKTGAETRSVIMDTRDVDGYMLRQFGSYRIVQTSEKEFLMETYLGGKVDALIRVVQQ